MTSDVEIAQWINESFLVVLVLTGSVEIAEQAVTKALGNVGVDDLRNALIFESVRWALQRTKGIGRLCPTLPRELKVLSFLAPIPLYCFVIRFLAGLEARTCSEILKLSRREVDEALYQALLKMPRALESFRGSCSDP
jgi:hypothetical protein